MDYNNKDWYYSPQTYPFYAPYQMQMQAGLPMQMQGNYLKEMEYEKDLDRMRELYPNEVKKIQKYVDEECDRMEYEGSLMYDEYPDRLMVRLLASKMAKEAAREMDPDREEKEELWLEEMARVLLADEICRRRCRRQRRRQRIWAPGFPI